MSNILEQVFGYAQIRYYGQWNVALVRSLSSLGLLSISLPLALQGSLVHRILFATSDPRRTRHLLWQERRF